ncbi:MAG: MoaD/ThiS family protein, partial [Anaerolineae bacterium]
MENIHVEVWLYGPLAKYGGSDDNIFALQNLELPAGTTVQDLLAHLEMPTEERGITFINGNLSAMPGLQPDLPHCLDD